MCVLDAFQQRVLSYMYNTKYGAGQVLLVLAEGQRRGELGWQSQQQVREAKPPCIRTRMFFTQKTKKIASKVIEVFRYWNT